MCFKHGEVEAEVEKNAVIHSLINLFDKPMHSSITAKAIIH